MMKKYLSSFVAVLLTGVVMLAGCDAADLEPGTAGSDPAGENDVGSSGGTDVYVNELLVNIMESFPVQVSVTVRGDLADGCVVLHGLTPVVENDGNWVIEIETSRDPDMMCTEALVPFEETVTLDVLGMPAGTYTVSAGEQSTTFTLDMDNAPPEATESLPVITLERTPCFGTCPVYALTVYGDGTAVFVGQDFVEQTGEHRAIIGVEGVNYLVDQFLDAGYLAWEDAYTNREMTDMPSAITSLTVDGRTKRIDHYHGDSSAPPALSDLEDLVDATVDTQQWIGEPQMGLANPATEHCLEQGGRSETRTGPEGNQYGVCIFEDGSECDEWAYFRGECEPSTEVSWDTAVDLISGGYVEMVAQLHDLTVELHLKDGHSLSTLEPAIDVVFAVVEACGDGCSDIVLATE